MSDTVTFYWKAACPHGHVGYCKYDGCQCDMFAGCTCGYQPCPGGTRGQTEFRTVSWCTTHDCSQTTDDDVCYAKDHYYYAACRFVDKLVEA